jgi:hypothetical protein
VEEPLSTIQNTRVRQHDDQRGASAARAAPTTSAAKLTVSRAAFAFLPRSLVAAISGVPRAVQMAAASAFRRGQQARPRSS